MAADRTPALSCDSAFVITLVRMLRHESPYCVAAAAGALSLIGRTSGGDKALVKAHAIPALVRIMQQAKPPVDLEKETGVFRRCAHQQ